jgi:glycosyltransferase involved in cell wall biosynthesis
VKIALVHDWLLTAGGAEKTLETIYELYPAPIFTLFFNKNNFLASPLGEAKIYTSFLQKFPLAKKRYRYYLPLYPLAIEQFNLVDYDLIISSSHAVAKGVMVRPEQIHICYCHTPMRYAWHLYHQYMELLKFKWFKKTIAQITFHYLRLWDVITAGRVNYFIANSRNTATHINKYYGKRATVIYPPVDVNQFQPNSKKEGFYLTISRLVPYKRVDLIIHAFAKMSDRRLVVIGDGPEFKKLLKIAPSNVKLIGHQSFHTVKDYLQKAKAFIFSAEEDFGIVMVEALACGTPVIALDKGGAKEIVKDLKTGILFTNQSVNGIKEAIERFEKNEDKFDTLILRKQALAFDKVHFQRKFKKFVESKKLYPKGIKGLS